VSPLSIEYNPLLRIAGEDATALEVLADSLAAGRLPIEGDLPEHDLHRADPYQIDPALAVADQVSSHTAAPEGGTTYAGLTPIQRAAFLAWAQDPSQEAPAAFRRLLIAHCEVGLFDEYGPRDALHRELLRWTMAPAWKDDAWLVRALLLSLWLASNGAGIAEYTSTVGIPFDLLETAVALQIVLEQDLRPSQAKRLAQGWHIAGADEAPEVVALRMRSLSDSLGKIVLDMVRGQLTTDDLTPRAWRTAHRDLRIRVPCPAIRPYLQPLLQEMFSLSSWDTAHTAGTVVNPAVSGPEGYIQQERDQEWQLVLQFGQSRSEFYEVVVQFAQKMPGYLQLLDEDARLVHRITFRKRELRHFWRIWEYVQNWSTTSVFLNGDELQKWKIWPYSQYLR
jgi:hypothetical protein